MGEVGNPQFKTDNHPGKLTQFSTDNQPETQGRPIGSKSRSTIARKILEMSSLLNDDMFERLKQTFPDIEQRMTAEEIATLAILGKAISNGDFNAYKAIMDSAYGAPKQEIENLNHNVNVLSNDPLNEPPTDDSATENISIT